MKLSKPIAFPAVTDINVTASTFDRTAQTHAISLELRNANGAVVGTTAVTLRPPVETTETVMQRTVEVDGAGREVVTGSAPTTRTVSDGGRCERVVCNPSPQNYLDAVRVEVFASATAYANSLVARKADDENAALEAAGLADGWIVPLS